MNYYYYLHYCCCLLLVHAHLLHVGGELLGLVSADGGLVPAGHLSDGLLQELSQLQLSSQTLPLLLLLRDTHTHTHTRC